MTAADVDVADVDEASTVDVADVDEASPLEADAVSVETSEPSIDGAVVDHVVLGYWLPETSRTRLEAAEGIELTIDPQRSKEAAVVLVSTRIPVGESVGSIAELAAEVAAPVIAIVHPGGESTGVALLSAGATGVIAEGNELAVVDLLGDGTDPAAFIETFEVTTDRKLHGRRRGSGADADAVTGLRGPGALNTRLGESKTIPRLGRVRIVGLSDVARDLTQDGLNVFRRRIADQLGQVVLRSGAEFYSVGPGEFAIVSDTMSVAGFERLAGELRVAAAGFSPDRAGSLLVALGHAGPEATATSDGLIDLSARCLDLAADFPEQGVVGMDKLAASLATSTELAVVDRAVAEVEGRDPYPGSHGERVAQYALAIAEALGIETRDLVTLRIAARFHDVGKLHLSDAAIAGMEDTLEGEALDEYKEHPERGAHILRWVAGNDVASAVEAHHEKWDGSGFPLGLIGDAIPFPARIIAVADALDRHSIHGHAPGRPTPDAIEKVSSLSGVAFAPAVVDAAVTVYGE